MPDFWLKICLANRYSIFAYLYIIHPPPCLLLLFAGVDTVRSLLPFVDLGLLLLLYKIFIQVHSTSAHTKNIQLLSTSDLIYKKILHNLKRINQIKLNFFIFSLINIKGIPA